MKTEIKASDTRYPALTRAVLARVDRESLADVCTHGASGGFPGFTYYAETCAFYAKHKQDILNLAESMASDLGEDMLTMIAGFGCLKADKHTPTEIGAAIFGNDKTSSIQNAMAWFALEEVARELNPDL